MGRIRTSESSKAHKINFAFLWFMRSDFHHRKRGYYYILVQTIFDVFTPQKPSVYAGFSLCNNLYKLPVF